MRLIRNQTRLPTPAPMARSFIQAVRPKNLPTGKEYAKAVDRAFDKATNAALRDYKATTKTWNHKVDFTVTVRQVGDDKQAVIGTDDEIYGYVNDGTEAHIIRPRVSPYLRFAFGGSPKTRAGVIGSRRGSPGENWRNASFVLHPGSAPRKFSESIAKRRQKTVEQETSQNIAKVARKQG